MGLECPRKDYPKGRSQTQMTQPFVLLKPLPDPTPLGKVQDSLPGADSRASAALRDGNACAILGSGQSAEMGPG